MTPALALDSITKRYAGHLAVDRLSLAVPTGTIYGILGPNGAGKSTTLRMAMNIIARDEGRVTLLGRDPASDREVLKRVGYLPEERGLYRKMKVLDVIVFFAMLKGMEEQAARSEGVRWLEKMGLGEWRDGRVETLSKGMQQKVQFITTVVHRPDVLVLDEPTSGLDPVNQEVLRDTILEARAEGRTVIFSTHNMDQAEQLCEYVCIIAAGRKVLDGALRDVRRSHMGSHYAIGFDDEPPGVSAFMRNGSALFSETRKLDDGWHVDLAPGVDVRKVIAALNSLDAPLARFSRVQPSLHEIFVKQVGDATTPHRRPEQTRV
ncbi:MAG TPA: ATP-binding cassette domain-containing protein [Gemmatimonadaceae bacterium]|nr:ATP-binding cassette domain-containing protein [Gemmatimonadaceae bacterium]